MNKQTETKVNRDIYITEPGFDLSIVFKSYPFNVCCVTAFVIILIRGIQLVLKNGTTGRPVMNELFIIPRVKVDYVGYESSILWPDITWPYMALDVMAVV